MHEINHIVSSIGFLQNVSQKLYVNLRQKVNYVNIYSQKERFCSTSLNLAQFAQSLLLNIAKKNKKKTLLHGIYFIMYLTNGLMQRVTFGKTFFIKTFCENVTYASVLLMTYAKYIA